MEAIEVSGKISCLSDAKFCIAYNSAAVLEVDNPVLHKLQPL